MSVRPLPDFLKRGDPYWGGTEPERRRLGRIPPEMLGIGDRGDVEEAIRAWRERVEKPSG